MKKIKVEDSIGYRLFHDITAMKDGFKGPLFKRGHIIEEKDVEILLDLGKRYIFVPEENFSEVHEEDCAIRMAECLRIPGVSFEGPSEGKMMMISEVSGMFKIDEKVLRQLNAIPDITVTSLPNHYPVNPGDRLMSMRIVPLFTGEEKIAEFENVLSDKRPVSVEPYRKLSVGIVITGSEVYSGRIPDKFEPIIRAKLKKYPSDIIGVSICDDDTDMIVEAAKKYISEGAGLILFSGGMSVDPDDLTPAAIKAMGAQIITYGVPAQPGNMTLVSYLGDVPLIGVPGAAIAKPTTVLDAILPQLFCGIRFTEEELINLGDGGLCQSCGSCHFPNCTFGRY